MLILRLRDPYLVKQRGKRPATTRRPSYSSNIGIGRYTLLPSRLLLACSHVYDFRAMVIRHLLSLLSILRHRGP